MRRGSRQRLAWLAGLACVLALCGLTLAARAEETEIMVWGLPRQRGLDAVLRRFEEEHPGLVVVRAAAGSGQTPQQLLTAVAGGSPPDLILQDRFAVAEWASRGAFQPLDEAIAAGLRAEQRAQAQPVDPARFYAGPMAECALDGALYAVPFLSDARALYYHEDLLEAAGIPGAPADWDALRDAAVRLTEREPSGALRRLGFAPNYGNSWLYLYSFLNGGALLSADGRRATLSSPQVVGALSYMLQVYDALGGQERVAAFQATFPGSSFDARAQELDPFLRRKVVMKIDGNWFLRTLAEHGGELRFAVAPPPAPRGLPSVTWSGGFAFAVPTGARHPQQAFELLRFLMSDQAVLLREQTEVRYAQSRGRSYLPMLQPMPHLNELLFQRLVQTDPNLSARLKRAYLQFTQLLPQARHRPVTPVGQLLWDEHVRATEQALRHQLSPLAALQAAEGRVQAELARVHAPASDPVLPLRSIGAALGALLAVLSCLLLRRTVKRVAALRGLEQQEAQAGYAFAAPWLLGFLVLLLGPLALSLLYSLCSYDVLHPPRFVGLRNYAALLRDPLLHLALANTAYMLLGLALNLIVSLALALLLHGVSRGAAAYRALLYLPTVVPAVASALLWSLVMNPELGLLNALLRALGVVDPPTWLQSASWGFGAKSALVLLGLWGLGQGVVLWLAGLREIPQQLYEAAALDGASAWQRFTRVTLPLLSPQILFQLILGVIGTLQLFTPAYILTQGGPADSTLFVSYHLFNHAFRYLHMGYASALAWLQFLLIMALSVVQLRLSARLLYYQGE